ncbi:MAG TPA: amino acid permease [Kofleriaceae bacterium]|nr:amino acid permease [Kofleriaceae bacterium]
MIPEAREHPRKIGWLSTTALAMGGSNQSLFLIGALIAGQGAIPGQGTAAIPLLVVGLILSWIALPGWTELILMWPNRVGGIAATCGEAFRPYAPVLGNLTGMSYWWGWIPTCGLTALLSASAISQWIMPWMPVPLLACLIIAIFVAINLAGVQWAARTATVIAAMSALLAFLSAIIPVVTGHVDWRQAASFHLDVPFAGRFGEVTSAMAGLYLIGFAAPAFEAAACHVGETIDPKKNIPRAMYASAGMATLYFLVLPVVWLGVIGPAGLSAELATSLGPTFAPLFGALGKSLAIGFMMFNMFHGTLAPLTGVARTLSQLSEDGLLPEVFAKRTKSDCPWVAIVVTAGSAIGFLLIGDPVWLVAAANFTYLIGIALPSVAVWLLRRDQPDLPRPYRAPRGMVTLGLIAALVWGVSTVIGFQQFGLPTVMLGLALAYSGAALYAWRKWMERRKAGLRGFGRSLHLKLTGAMLLVLALDAAGYYLAVSSVAHDANPELVTVLADIFVAVAILTITVGLVLPGMIAHSAVEVSKAADRLATGTLADFSRAMTALANGDLDHAQARVEFLPVIATSRDEVGDMARSFNTLQQEIALAAMGLSGAREGLSKARAELTEANVNLEMRVVARTVELEAAHKKLVIAARRAGMAEVAIGILHNIGNVLNSVNVSVSMLDQLLRASRQKAEMLPRLAALLDDSSTELGRAVKSDVKGHHVIEYLRKLSATLDAERGEALGELDSLIKSVEHMKQIVNSQQSLARGATLIESFDLVELTEEAVRINTTRIAEHAIVIERAFEPLAPVSADKHLLLQILVNLISNAVRAVSEAAGERKVIRLAVHPASATPDRVVWQIEDTGVGIAAAHMARIFESGFTTRSTGQGGFGLHNSALAAKRMAGSLQAFSDGEGQGARFVLELPSQAAAPTAQMSVAS